MAAWSEDHESSRIEIEIQEAEEEAPMIQPEPWNMDLRISITDIINAPPIDELQRESIALYDLDLFMRVQELLEFLEMISRDHIELQDAKILKLATARCLLWFILLDRATDPASLVPPVDVALVWHSLLIRRIFFSKFIETFELQPSILNLSWRSALSGSEALREATKTQWDQLTAELAAPEESSHDDKEQAEAQPSIFSQFQAEQLRSFGQTLLWDYDWNGKIAVQFAQRVGECRIPSMFGMLESTRHFRLSRFSWEKIGRCTEEMTVTLELFTDSQMQNLETCEKVLLRQTPLQEGCLALRGAFVHKKFHLILDGAVQRNLEEFLQMNLTKWTRLDLECQYLPKYCAKDQQWIAQTQEYPFYETKRQGLLCAVFQQYKQWLALLSSKQRTGHFWGPPFHIDIFWHAHMLCPIDYSRYTAKCGHTYWHRPQSDTSRSYGCCICS